MFNNAQSNQIRFPAYYTIDRIIKNYKLNLRKLWQKY